MMQLRSACTNKTVMSTEDVVKSLFSLQRKISGCLRPSRSLAQTLSSYKEVLAQATLETDAYVGSSLGWEHIFGIPFPSKEGEM